MTYDQFVSAQAALLCWRAAPQKSLDQFRGIAFMLRNRVQAGWNDGEWLHVVANYNRHAASDPDSTFPAIRNPDWRKFLIEFDAIFNGMAPNRMVDAGLYMCDPADVRNPWFAENVIGQPAHAHCATVSPLLFFK